MRPRLDVLEDRRLLSSGRVQFSPPVAVPMRDTPNSAVVADFNGDGKLDLAVDTGVHDVGIALGNGNGTFQPAQFFSANPSPFFPSTLSLAQGDFNRDGKPDLVVSTFSGNQVGVLLNTSTGGVLSFAPAQTHGAGAEPVFVTVGDLNRDGKADIVTANIAADPASSVGVLLGVGDGTFQDVQFVAAGANANSAAIGDFNRDGRPDLAVTYSASTGPSANRVGILLGLGDGSFGPVNFFAAGTTPISIAVGDFNRDGNRDLAVANGNSNNVTILLGNGGGNFRRRATYRTGIKPISVVAADFNGDGRADLAVANSGGNTVRVLVGRGNGTFNTNLRPFAAGGRPNGAMAVGRLSGRFLPDLAVPVVNGQASVLLNRTRLGRGRHR